MGQRLVTVIQDEKQNKLCAIWQHWSAYTGSTIDTANQIASHYGELITDNNGKLNTYQYFDEEKKKVVYQALNFKKEIIKALMNLNMTLDMADGLDAQYKALYKKGIRNLMPSFGNGDRNVGLITFTERGIESMIGGAEGLLYLTLNSKTGTLTFSSCDVWFAMPKDEFETKKEYEQEKNQAIAKKCVFKTLDDIFPEQDLIFIEKDKTVQANYYYSNYLQTNHYVKDTGEIVYPIA